MPIYSRLDSPSYDLGWLDLPNDDAVMLLPGGGGSTKSGIKNLVQVAKVSKKGFKFLPGVNTEDNLPCAVSSGRIKVRRRDRLGIESQYRKHLNSSLLVPLY
jgi:hypothetical protein